MSARPHVASLRRRWFGNSVVNLMGGVATAGVNVLLPAIVVKHLDAESFSIWNLALQMGVYVNLLSMGLQTATARAISHASDGNPQQVARLPTIVRAARSISYGASGVAVILAALLVAVYPLLFPSISPALISDFRITLALFGLAAITQILAQVDMGVFQGLHRNAAFVSVQMATRLITVLVVWAGVRTEKPMVILALLMAVSTAMLWPAMRVVLLRAVPWARQVSRSFVDKGLRGELLLYCGTLVVWSVSMLLVNSVGIIIVGRLDFVMAGPYAIAMTGASVIVGLLSAALSPLMTTAAALHATEETRSRLPVLLNRATLGVAIGLNLLVLCIAALHPLILKLWVGPQFIHAAGPMLVVLVGAHCLRNIAAPYSLMLLATGLHRRALLSAIIEGVANLTASILLGIQWGAIGVALGTLIGAAIGVLGTLALNGPQTPELTPEPLRFSAISVALPLFLFAPFHYLVLRGIA